MGTRLVTMTFADGGAVYYSTYSTCSEAVENREFIRVPAEVEQRLLAGDDDLAPADLIQAVRDGLPPEGPPDCAVQEPVRCTVWADDDPWESIAERRGADVALLVGGASRCAAEL